MKKCTTKKEAALERAMLNNEVSTVGAIFSLKQLGWTDRTEQTHKGAMAKPEEVEDHLRCLARNLEKLCVRTHKLAGIDAKPQAEAASKLHGKH